MKKKLCEMNANKYIKTGNKGIFETTNVRLTNSLSNVLLNTKFSKRGP